MFPNLIIYVRLSDKMWDAPSSLDDAGQDASALGVWSLISRRPLRNLRPHSPHRRGHGGGDRRHAGGEGSRVKKDHHQPSFGNPSVVPHGGWHPLDAAMYEIYGHKHWVCHTFIQCHITLAFKLVCISAFRPNFEPFRSFGTIPLNHSKPEYTLSLWNEDNPLWSHLQNLKT